MMDLILQQLSRKNKTGAYLIEDKQINDEKQTISAEVSSGDIYVANQHTER